MLPGLRTRVITSKQADPSASFERAIPAALLISILTIVPSTILAEVTVLSGILEPSALTQAVLFQYTNLLIAVS